MSLTTFSFPTTTLFGVGSLSELPERMRRLGLTRPLVVTDAGLLKTTAFKALDELLKKGTPNKTRAVYSGVRSNPFENEVREAASTFREHDCDSVLAIGG